MSRFIRSVGLTVPRVAAQDAICGRTYRRQTTHVIGDRGAGGVVRASSRPFPAQPVFGMEKPVARCGAGGHAQDMSDKALTIVPLTADPEAVEQARRILVLAGSHDVPDFPTPSRDRFAKALATSWPGQETHRFVALDGADMVGFLSVELFTLDNLETASLHLSVPPAHRRRGIGRALYRHGVALLPGLGRRLIVAMSSEALPGGPPRDPAGGLFATAMGMTNALNEVRRRLDVSTVDRPALDALLAASWPKADGYSLLRWVGPTPDEWVDDIAMLNGRLLEDAPMGELALEPERIDADRERRSEKAHAACGDTWFTTAVRHDASGRVVGHSLLMREGGHPNHAWQGTTLVHPNHRGHRLGTIVKVENLRLAMAHLPELRYIDTWNAGANDYMIRINEAMGFRKVDNWCNWQQEI